jgi:hypothetical protein
MDLGQIQETKEYPTKPKQKKGKERKNKLPKSDESE